MTDIAYWYDEYARETDLYTDLSSTLTSLIESNSTNNRKIIKTIAECDAKAGKLRDIKKSFGLELRLIKDRAQRSEFDSKMKLLDERVMLLNKDLKLAKIKQNKQDLFQDTATNRNQFSTEGEPFTC